MVLKECNDFKRSELINGDELKETNGLETFHLIKGLERNQWSWKNQMVLKKTNGLERIHMINDVERMQWSWKKPLDEWS